MKTKSKKGKGKDAKSGLNKAILRNSWYEIKRQLEYKLDWKDGVLILNKPHYTSQHCPNCNHIEAANRKTQEKFCCVLCGYTENADAVGAYNQLFLGKNPDITFKKSEKTKVFQSKKRSKRVSKKELATTSVAQDTKVVC